MDATRIADGEIVMMKRVVDTEHSDELGITKLFSSKPLVSDPKNHCLPLFDVLQVPDYEGMILLVMPILRSFNQPKIWTYGEAVEFFRKVIEVCPCPLHTSLPQLDDVSRHSVYASAPLCSSVDLPWRF